MFLRNNLPSFHLCWKEYLVKDRKVSKYYEIGSLQTIFLLFMFFITTNFVENSHSYSRIFFIFLKTGLNQTWNAFNTKFGRQWKDRKRSYRVSETFAHFCNLIAPNFALNSVKSLRVSKIVTKNNFKWVWQELESKKCFQRQSVTKYLRLTLVSMWKRTPGEKFNRYFLAPSSEY